MSIIMGSGQTTVSGTVTGQFTPAIKTVSLISSGLVDNTNSTLGTVGAGKKWSIIGATLAVTLGGGSAKTATLNINGTPILASAQHTSTGTSNLSNNFQYGLCPTLAAGQTITLNNTNGANYPAAATVQYIEEDA